MDWNQSIPEPIGIRAAFLQALKLRCIIWYGSKYVAEIERLPTLDAFYYLLDFHNTDGASAVCRRNEG